MYTVGVAMPSVLQALPIRTGAASVSLASGAVSTSSVCEATCDRMSFFSSAVVSAWSWCFGVVAVLSQSVLRLCPSEVMPFQPVVLLRVHDI